MDKQIVVTALDQINWKRKRDGTYSGNDPLLSIQSKLWDIREGEANTLTISDIESLITITNESLKHLGQYDYGFSLNVDEDFRQQAMQPLFELKNELDIQMRKISERIEQL